MGLVLYLRVMTLDKLFTPLCPCDQAAKFGTGQCTVKLRGWKGNHRSGIVPAMHHRLQSSNYLRAQGL